MVSTVLAIAFSFGLFLECFCQDNVTENSGNSTGVPWWYREAIKDISYYLRNHKFNEYDRRYETKPEAAERRYYKTFPKPPLRSLHWEVKRYCEENFTQCIEYMYKKLRHSSLKRSEDTSIIIQEQKWSLEKNMSQIKQVDENCKKMMRVDSKLAKPFEGPLERFQWRTTASYYLCHYTLKEEEMLKHINEECDNFANCLDDNFGSNNKDYRAKDSIPFSCALYSFCPDPCCPIKYMNNTETCLNATENPCYRNNEYDQRHCTFNKMNNIEFNDIVLNRWNVTCKCRDVGHLWSSRYGICIDIDECISRETCKNQSEACLNTPGSYRCVCEWGHVKDANNKCVPSLALKDIKLGSKEKKRQQTEKGFNVLYRKFLHTFFAKSSAKKISFKATYLCYIIYYFVVITVYQ